ncbi:hypothetical protein [Rahnella contaminans]|uniref:hypothetical protein n=2 Tax=Rahnella TaxID=34037 RepID=UPI003C2AE5D4
MMSTKYLNILKLIEIEEKRKRVKKEKHDSDVFILLLCIVLVAISVTLAFIYHITKNDWIKLSSIVLLLLAYITLPVMNAYKIYSHRAKIKRSFALPFRDSVDLNIKSEFFIDGKYLPYLTKLKNEELRLGILEVKHERTCLEKRMTLMIGPIDKFGILPGVVATIATLIKIPGAYNWVTAIAYGYIGLTFISIFFYQLIMRYDRMIALTELALEIKSEASKI